ncbi:MAG: hypothetical protein JXR03_03410 [Cyclobacteriaceae bacterium]
MIILLESQLSLFIGRFHPLVVHLPIGFIIIAVFFELISWRKKIELDVAIAYALILGATFGVIAIALGLLLASDDGYNVNTLNIHKWTGIATAVASLLAYFLKIKSTPKLQKAYPYVLGVSFLLLSVTGHYGGNLTHGSTYLLDHAPKPVRSLAGLKPSRERVTSLDSAILYSDVINPIFESKCLVCHNTDKAKGELLLIDPESIMKGGESGAVISVGNASESEIFRRVSLDPHHKEFMPTDGRDPLSKEETALLEWWIEEGASFDKRVIDFPLTERIKGYLKEVGIGMTKSFLESLNIPHIEQQTFDAILGHGFDIEAISDNTTLLDASYATYNLEELTSEKLQSLLLAKENITWLKLSKSSIKDDWLAHIGQLPNLTRLSIDQTMITDEGLKHLTSLKNLEYLNIYATPLSDRAIESIQKLRGLKKLFIWQTNITEEGIAKLKELLPDLEIIAGT